MSRSRSLLFLIRVAWLAAAVAASVAVVGYVRWAVKLDPFARFRPGDNSSDAMRVAVRLNDVKLWNWKENKLVLACEMGRVDIRKDRQHLDFYEVRNGIYNTDKENFKFSGEHASYNAGMQLFEVDSGARVWSKDLDLKASGLKYRQRTGQLRTLGEVTGRLLGGQIVASNLVYYPDTRDFDAGPIEWTGKLKNSPLQEIAGEQSSVPWKIKGNARARGELHVYTNGEASDGDIIVKSPTMEWNRKTDVLTATGKVEYYSKKANLICDKAVIYRKEKRAVLTGNVTMLVKPEDEEKLEVVEIQPFRPVVPDEVAASRPKPPGQLTEEEKKRNEELRSSKSARKYPTSITSEKIEYWYRRGERRAVVTGSPQARQDFPNGRWRHMWTATAYYDAEKETLKLVSSEGKKNTRVITSIGDDLIATWFQTSTKEDGEDNWEGDGVEGTVISDDDDLNRRNNPPPTTNTRPPRLRGPIGGRV